MDRTRNLLEAVGWKLVRSGSELRVEPGDQASDSSHLEVLSALGVDAIAMQQTLQAGETFSFEIPSEEANLFGGSTWLMMLKDPNIAGGIAAAFTLDFRLAQTYAALSAMDSEAATALAAGVGLRNLVTRYSSTALHFANAFQVSGHAVVVPGGKALEPAWQDLAGAKTQDPPAFFKAVLTKDQGGSPTFIG